MICEQVMGNKNQIRVALYIGLASYSRYVLYHPYTPPSDIIIIAVAIGP